MKHEQLALTRVEREAYAIIRRMVRIRGVAPSHRELAKDLGVTHQRAGFLIEAIEIKGWIACDGTPRGIKLLEPEPPITVDDATAQLVHALQDCIDLGMTAQLADVAVALQAAYPAPTIRQLQNGNGIGDILAKLA